MTTLCIIDVTVTAGTVMVVVGSAGAGRTTVWRTPSTLKEMVVDCWARVVRGKAKARRPRREMGKNISFLRGGTWCVIVAACVRMECEVRDGEECWRMGGDAFFG